MAREELARERRLQVRTGFVPVRGEGVRVTVSDPPRGDIDDLVRDEDLALLVDGFWRAGAEAVAINNQRLTALSPIRNEGPAINVNSRPVNAPYVVSAIGDTLTLQAELLETTHGQRFFDLADDLGFVYEMQNVDELSLPGDRLPRLRHVAVGTAPDRARDAGRRGGPPVIAALGLLLGIVLGLFFEPDVPSGLEPYLPIAVVAALDAVFGGLRAYLDGIFDDKVFVVSFFSNVVIAAAIVYLGDKLGVGGQLSTGVIVVLGIRIFSNVAAIRRHLFHA